MKVKKIDRVMEICFSVFSVLGALLVSNQIHVGWIVWLISSTIGIIWAFRSHNYWVCGMNTFFTISNIMGVYNYLLV